MKAESVSDDEIISLRGLSELSVLIVDDNFFNVNVLFDMLTDTNKVKNIEKAFSGK